jgi:hypothetical protein
MNKKEFDEQQLRLSRYANVTRRIDDINAVVDHQSLIKNNNVENTSLKLVSYVQGSSLTKEVFFNSNHPISKAIIKLLKDEVICLEKERDKI